MNFFILGKCFLIGILGNLTLGPIFILTFNRGALFGFRRGFASALAASVADGFLFMLGLMGALSLVTQLQGARLILYGFGAIFLLVAGINSLRYDWRAEQMPLQTNNLGVSFSSTFIKAFFMTLSNPLAIGYFAATSISLLAGMQQMLKKSMIGPSLFVGLGTLAILTMVSFVASRMGECIAPYRFGLVRKITGMVFIFFSCYLLFLLVLSFLT